MTGERLDELEELAWAGFLLTHERLRRAMEATLSEVGMTMAEYNVLAVLEGVGPRGMRLSELASRRLMTTGGFPRLADRLERRGLIERRRSPADGRGLDAFLTPSGRRALQRARKRHLADVRELFLTPLAAADLERLRDVWARLQPTGRPTG